MPVRTFRLFASACVGALALVALPACSGAEDVAAFRDEAAALRDDLHADAARWQAAAEAEPDQSPSREGYAALAAESRLKADAAGVAVTRLDEALAEVEHPTDSITSLARAASGWLPEPFRMPLVLGAGLIAVVARAAQLKRSAASIAASLETAMRQDPQLRERLGANADTIRAAQTKTAMRIVDEVQGKKPLVTLPV